MQREYDDQFWKNSLSFFWMESALSTSIIQVIKQGCTATGAHSGSGSRVAKFMVAVSYGNGVILCEQYEKLNGPYFKSLVQREFPRMFNIAAKGGPKLFIQDRDPSQNSCIACTVWRKLGAKLISIPARSPDIYCIENTFNIIKEF